MSEPLKVDPAALDVLAGKLAKLADDNEAKTGSYLKEWLDVPGDVGGIIPIVAQAVHDIRDKLTSNYPQLGSLTAASSNELTKSAAMYRTTDKSTAEALYRTYPEVKR